jgi:hypothetical protein
MPRLFAPHERWLVALSVSCVALVAPAVRAETEAIRIEYRALPGCPSAEEFHLKVFERAASARLASEGDAARTFVIAIERRPVGVAGSLVVREPSGETVAREVAGKDCDEVATALALATALAIDPRALPAPKPPTPPTPSQAEPKAGGRPPPPSPAPADRAGWWSAALGPRIEIGISPDLSLGGSLRGAWHSGASRAFFSGGGIELSWSETPQHFVGTASSSFRFLLARPFLCSFELALTEALHASPCLAAALGAVTGTGERLPAPATETRVWVAAELLLRFRLQATELWFVELDGALGLPFTRYSFVFRQPDTQIYRVSALAAGVGLRVGLRL